MRQVGEGLVDMGSGTKPTHALRAAGVTTKRGKPINKGDIYKLLNNRTYLGEAAHKGNVYPALWRAPGHGSTQPLGRSTCDPPGEPTGSR
jgi:hypothetical protein